VDIKDSLTIDNVKTHLLISFVFFSIVLLTLRLCAKFEENFI